MVTCFPDLSEPERYLWDSHEDPLDKTNHTILTYTFYRDITSLNMTTIIRSQILLRSSCSSTAFAAVRIAQRHPVRSTLGARYNSTALDKEVKAKEEHSRSDNAVVGGSGKGAEGVHFQGTSRFLHIKLEKDRATDDRSNDQFTFDTDQR